MFEKNVLPLEYQKNNREIELICHECILHVVRDSMPVEKILRAYIDKTVDEEVLEETIEKTVEENVAKQIEEKLETTNDSEDAENKITKSEQEVNSVEKPELTKNVENTEKANTEKENTEKTNDMVSSNEKHKNLAQNINLIIETPKAEDAVKDTVESMVSSTVASSLPEKESMKNPPPTPTKLSFNDNDSVLDMGTNKSQEVSAPKTIERLEQISKEQNEKRKLEEAEEDDDEDEKLTIMGDTSIKLDTLDVHNLDKEIKLEPNILLDDIEVLG